MKTVNSPLYEADIKDVSVRCNCTNNAIKFYLPACETGQLLITKTDSSANAVTLLPVKGQTLSNATCQVETATIVGTVTRTGNATVVVTAAGMEGSPITLNVAVLNTDTATKVAGRIIQHMSRTKAITDMFAVSGSGITVVLTQLEPTGNDSTLNISVDNGTCTGLTTAASSANTTAGVSVTLDAQNESKVLSCNGKTWAVTDSYTPNLVVNVASHNYGAAHADWTLSTMENKASRIIVTNADSGVNVIATPTAGKVLMVLNTSGQSLVVKASGQTGVTIASTKSAIVIGNGTDFVRVTGDA